MRGQIDNILHTQKILFILCGQIEINLHTQKILFIIIIYLSNVNECQIKEAWLKLRLKWTTWFNILILHHICSWLFIIYLCEPRDSSYWNSRMLYRQTTWFNMWCGSSLSHLPSGVTHLIRDPLVKDQFLLPIWNHLWFYKIK